jgi:hypothetical protein
LIKPPKAPAPKPKRKKEADKPPVKANALEKLILLE